MSVGYIIGVEAGQRKAPTIERCKQIAKALDLSEAERVQLIQLATIERASDEHRPFLEDYFRKVKIARSLPPEAIPMKHLVRIPLLGSAPAGPKSFGSDEVESWHEFPKEIVKGRRLYLLRVTGDSMNRAGIESGDIVVVDADKEPTNGAAVVIRVDGDATIKRFYRTNDQITLTPDSTNPEHQPMIVGKRSEVLLRGVVEAVWMKKIT